MNQSTAESLHDSDDVDFDPIDGHFTPLARASELPPKWVIQDLIPEGLIIIAGPPKDAKKSTLTLAVMALVAGYRGRVLPPEFKSKAPGRVMVFSFEATAGEILHTARQELEIDVQDDNGIIIADRPEEFLLDDPSGKEQMLHWFDSWKPRLVVIDPLRNAHTLDEKDSGDLVRILLPLRRWAKENECAVIVVHHTRKTSPDNSVDRAFTAQDMRGSSALYGLADGVIMITPRPQPMTFTYAATFKRGKSWEKTIMLAGYETKGQRPGEALRQSDQAILRAIRGGFSKLPDIAKEANLTEKNVGERLHYLMDAGRVRFQPKEGYFAQED